MEFKLIIKLLKYDIKNIYLILWSSKFIKTNRFLQNHFFSQKIYFSLKNIKLIKYIRNKK